jgi:uncharacterized oxidoreductase
LLGVLKEYSRNPIEQILVNASADSQLADGLHEVVHFSVHGRLADSQVLLHADAGKEGQDHLCNYRWFHLGFLGFDISRDQIFEKSVALRNDFLRRAWEHRELVHGIDREAAFLALRATWREFQKALDVLPAKRVGGEQLFLVLFSQVVSQTLQIQVSLVHELGIEAGLVYARSLFQVDLQDPKSIASVAKKLIAQYPKLNVLINNAGIMQIDDAAGVVDDAVLVSIVNTNLQGTIRVTLAFIEHLKRQPAATVIYNTSVLGYVPLAMTAVYSSTKAALHSYVLSQRYKLKNTTVSVLEIAPPWVQTDLMGSNNEPRAMPLAEFMKETIDVLGTDAQEILVERAKPLRNNPGPNEGALVTQFNDSMLQQQS